MDIIEVFQYHGIPYMDYAGDRHWREGWIQLHCPFCLEGEYHWHLGFNLYGKYFNCWACGFHSIQSTFRKFMPGENISKIIKNLEIPITDWEMKKAISGKLKIPKFVQDSILPYHYKYLKKRGYIPEEVKDTWGIQSIAHHPKLSWRLFIPIANKQGKIVSWTTRDTTDKHMLKYWSASPREEFTDHKTLLYGEQYVKHTIIVCEGPLDVWKVGPGSVATFGKNYCTEQLQKIVRYPRRVVLFDTDALNDGEALAKEIACFPGETFHVTLDSSDPGEATQKEINKIRRTFLMEK